MKPLSLPIGSTCHFTEEPPVKRCGGVVVTHNKAPPYHGGPPPGTAWPPLGGACTGGIPLWIPEITP